MHRQPLRSIFRFREALPSKALEGKKVRRKEGSIGPTAPIGPGAKGQTPRKGTLTAGAKALPNRSTPPP